MVDSITSVLVPIHREGYKFLAIFAAVTFILFFVAVPLGWIGVVLTLWCAYFFRDPERVTPEGDGLVISPADGVISAIEQVPPPPELEMGESPMTRVSVFMNVFNCHVNRAPVGGRPAAAEQDERGAQRCRDPRHGGSIRRAGCLVRR